MNTFLRIMLVVEIIAFYGGFLLLSLLGTDIIKEQSDTLVGFDFCCIVLGVIFSIVFGILLVFSNAKKRSREIVDNKQPYIGKYKEEVLRVVSNKLANQLVFFDLLFIGVIWLIIILQDIIFSGGTIHGTIFSTVIACQISIFQRSKFNKDDEKRNIQVNGVKIYKSEDLERSIKTIKIDIDILTI